MKKKVFLTKCQLYQNKCFNEETKYNLTQPRYSNGGAVLGFLFCAAMVVIFLVTTYFYF